MKNLVFLFVILALICSPLFAQLVVTTTGEPDVGSDPSWVVYNNTIDTKSNNTRRWHYDTETPDYDSKHHDVGQTFIPVSSFTLDKLVVKISKRISYPVNLDACKGSAFHLDIYTFANNTGSQTPSSVVTSQGGNLPAGFDLENEQYLQIDLQDVSIQAGTIYGFLLKFDAIKSGQCIKIIKTHLWDTFSPGQLLTVGFGDGRSNETFNHHYSDAEDYDLMFWLQSAAGGGGDPAPAVSGISPNSVSNIHDRVNCTLQGSHFQNGATARLTKTGESDIYATDITVNSSTQINCDFAVGGHTPGLWNVVVQNPDHQESGTSGNTLFSITAPGAQQVQVTTLSSNPVIDASMVAYNDVNDKPANDWSWFYHSGSSFTPPHRDIGQIFTAPADFELDKVYVKISGSAEQYQMTACQGAPFHIALLQFDDAGQNALPTDTLSNQQGNLPSSLIKGDDRIFCFDMQNLSLQAGKKYGFLLQFDILQSNQFLPLVKTDVADYYNGGTYLYVEFDGNSGRENVSSWNWVHSGPVMKRDLNFWIQKSTAPADPAPVVASMTPNVGTDTESVFHTSISGDHFQNGARVKLTKSGELDIAGTNVIFYNENLITAVFDLTGAEAGLWNVMVVNPDNQTSGSSGNDLLTISSGAAITVQIANSAFQGTTVIVDGVEHTAPYDTQWVPNSSHTISIQEIQPIDSDERYHFNSWSDGKSITHTVAPSTDTVFVAYMFKQIKPTIALQGTDAGNTATVEEHHKNFVNYAPSDVYGTWSDWCDTGSVLRFSARTGGFPVKETTDAREWTVNSPFAATIHYAQNGYAAKITTSIGSGSQVIVDGQTYNAPFTAVWKPGSQHSIAIPSPQAAGTAKQYSFSQWSNGKPQSHTIIVQSDTTIIADLITQFKPTIVLSGTDASHTVNLETHTKDGVTTQQSGLYYSWSDWCDSGTELRFGQWTSGSPQKQTLDTRSWNVNSVFTTTLHYATSAPVVKSVTPNSATNTGPVNISDLSGENFQQGAVVRLTKTGENDIVATNIVVHSAQRISCVFDLSGVAGGAWNVVVINPDQQSSGESGNTLFFVGAPDYIDVVVTTDIGNGTSVVVDGQSHQAPYQNQWIAGSQHRIGVNTPQIASPTQQFIFSHWSDTKDLEHFVTPVSDTSFIADMIVQYKPTIKLNGTDALHTVSTEAHTKNGKSFQISGYYDTWSDWCDKGSELRFSQTTTGSPVRITHDNRSWMINSAFMVTIHYLASAPYIDTVSPDSIAPGSGQVTLTINGSNFQEGAMVILQKAGENDILASDVQHVSSNKLICLVYASGMNEGVWDVVVSNPDGQESGESGTGKFVILTATGVLAEQRFPQGYGLLQNYPNPFNPATSIVYKLDKAGNVRLDIYSIKGEWIGCLVNEKQGPGVYRLSWNGREDGGNAAASGLYLYVLTTERWQQSRKMVLFK
ncbi:hypothetical protein GF407_07165 [candidate division KSB1 bacterium]|nr:hypothetical protein [candidate division KSB1 bacterium]